MLFTLSALLILYLLMQGLIFPTEIIKVSFNLICSTRVTVVQSGSMHGKANSMRGGNFSAGIEKVAGLMPTLIFFCSRPFKCLMGLSPKPEKALGTFEIDPTVPGKWTLCQGKDC